MQVVLSLSPLSLSALFHLANEERGERGALNYALLAWRMSGLHTEPNVSSTVAIQHPSSVRFLVSGHKHHHLYYAGHRVTGARHIARN